MLKLEKLDDCAVTEPPVKKKRSAMDFLLGETGEAVILTNKDEMEYFSQEPALDHNSDPLDWWRKNKERFPALSNLVKKLFCIPGTSVPSKRIFSVPGNIVTKKRSSLKPENVDMLVFLHKNLPPVSLKL